MGLETLFVIAIIVISIVLHEVAHGYAADALGDPTARLSGRLTPNPIPHIDPIGSLLVPGLLYITSAGFIFGWAKPVPYNPYNLRNQRWGEAIVAAAGPLTNLLLAIIFALLIRSADVLSLNAAFIDIAYTIVSLNVLLFLFNMIPLPPLDGSKVIEPFLPYRLQVRYRSLGALIERFGILGSLAFVFIFIFILWAPFSIVVQSVVGFLTGS